MNRLILVGAFAYWSVPLLVEPHDFLSRFGSLLV